MVSGWKTTCHLTPRKTQPKCFQYRITSYEEPKTAEEWLDFNDAWDAIGGDWQG